MIINKLKSNNNDINQKGSPNGNENICKTFSFSSNYLTKNSVDRASESFVMWVKFKNINVSLLTLMYAIT